MEYLTPKQAADRLGVHINTIYNMIARGELPHYSSQDKKATGRRAALRIPLDAIAPNGTESITAAPVNDIDLLRSEIAELRRLILKHNCNQCRDTGCVETRNGRECCGLCAIGRARKSADG